VLAFAAARTRVRIWAEPSAEAPPAQFFVLDGGDLDVDVDAVEQRAGDLGHIALNHGWGGRCSRGSYR